MHVNVRETEDILDDATKSQIKMENELKDPIVIEKKQNVCTIDYNKLSALYEDFVPQKELSAEQKYFSSTFIPSKNPSNARTLTSTSEIKPPLASMPSTNPMKLYLEKMENEFKMLFALLQTNSKRESIFYTTPEEIRYGYCKNLKKTVKTGQTRTRERKENTRAGRTLSKFLIFTTQQSSNQKPTPFTIVERIVQFVVVFACLRDVAIASIKFGLWDRMSSVLEEINKEGPANTNSTKCVVDVKTDVEPAEQDVLVASKHVSKGCAAAMLCLSRDVTDVVVMLSNHVAVLGYEAITTRSGVAYEGPSIPTNPSPKKVVERETKETTDKEQTNFQEITAQIPPPVIPISIPKPDVPKTLPKTTSIPESDIPKNLRFDISFADALLLMPRFAPTIKSLLINKEKLLELAKIPLNENCSAMLLKKLPEKLGDPGKFLIPCNFPGMDICHALADLSASINLMPLSIWKKLSLPELTPTRMTLELADRSITYPKGLALKIVLAKLGISIFLPTLLLSFFEADARFPLILCGDPFEEPAVLYLCYTKESLF
ncbi:reverse transcriptase domain-containing protein [Tanacetum coccineum]